MYLAPLTAALTTAKHCDWKFAEQTVEDNDNTPSILTNANDNDGRSEEQEQLLTMQTTVKAKDPKKQEAGRKGAMARQQKLEAVQAQLITTKTGSSCKATNNEEHAEPVARTASQGSGGPGWGVGIGLAVAVGVALFTMKRATGMKRVPSSEEAKPLVQLAAAPVQFAGGSRPMFDME